MKFCCACLVFFLSFCFTVLCFIVCVCVVLVCSLSAALSPDATDTSQKPVLTFTGQFCFISSHFLSPYLHLCTAAGLADLFVFYFSPSLFLFLHLIFVSLSFSSPWWPSVLAAVHRHTPPQCRERRDQRLELGRAWQEGKISSKKMEVHIFRGHAEA